MTQSYIRPTYSSSNSEKNGHNKTQPNENAIASPQNNGNNTLTVAQAIAKIFEDIGVRDAFGVSGGAMATIWAALSNSPLIQVTHCRHEGGAAFAATENHFASDRPVVVFTTAGPGMTNAITGLLAARGEGAKVILVSACTSATQRGRWAIQETSSYTIPKGDLFAPGVLFNYATIIESSKQLPQIAKRLALGVSRPGGFVAHISIPTGLQSTAIETTLPTINLTPNVPVASKEAIARSVELMKEGSFAIWVGFGARHAAEAIRQLAERTGAAVMCSPRAKGIFPENHPQYIGVTGLGGHESVMRYMEEQTPLRTLVLGTRLGEPTSFWSDAMIPPKGFVHVDIDPEVPGVAYSHAETFPVVSDVGAFVEALLEHFPENSNSQTVSFPNPESMEITAANNDLIRPEAVMEMVQRLVVDRTDSIVLAESGNSFTWSTHFLRFDKPNRYRVSTGVGSMGHNVTGVIGAALGEAKKAVAIVGDGAMLMNNEISTAVKYQIPAVWIVLNDARYNMCYQGMSLLGLTGADAILPPTDFALVARGMGAQGIRVDKESDLEAAITEAMNAKAPVVLDVAIDPDRMAPSKGRNKSLSAQGVQSTAPKKHEGQISFPLV
ncbi:MAG: scytonemin biosynthesis protein ScyA [Hydrococcus sp. Prado102]|jgi:acetolactate synthase-1/2/3 large subunit|nr:scytonemin biosynthesis protein ScyA [Hydrococcus sp. Prado102]